jgi:hypothetical protein
MTAAVRPGPLGTIPVPRSPGDTTLRPVATRAVSYQRVLHQMVRRELRLLADLATWAPADESARTMTLACHADLISRVLLHHHAAMACLDVADAVDEQTATEERDLLPALAAYLHRDDWNSIARSARCRLTADEQLLVLGLALEDACATDRARLLEGLPRSARMAWRMHGRRTYRAAVVRLRGAPPAR